MIITHTEGKYKNSVCNDGNSRNLNIKGEIHIFRHYHLKIVNLYAGYNTESLKPITLPI